MKRSEVSDAVRLQSWSLGVKGLRNTLGRCEGEWRFSSRHFNGDTIWKQMFRFTLRLNHARERYCL